MQVREISVVKSFRLRFSATFYMCGVNKFNRGQFLNLQIQKGEGRTQRALRGPASTRGPLSGVKTELCVRLVMSSTRCTLVKVHLWVGPPQRRRPLGFGGSHP